jgi:hypothetical protein
VQFDPQSISTYRFFILHHRDAKIALLPSEHGRAAAFPEFPDCETLLKDSGRRLRITPMNFLYRLVCALLLVAGGHAAEPGADALSDLVVPVDSPSEMRDAATGAMKEVLAPYAGKAARKPVFDAADGGRGVLWGDLFQTGECFALVELSEQNDEDPAAVGVAFVEWTGGGWTLRGLWKIPTVWRPAGWQSSGGDYLPKIPATQPFWLAELSGDDVPEVIIAGAAEKYFQEHFLLRFIPETKQLRLVAFAMDQPEKVEDYVRLYADPGRRAIWSEWEFCKWEGTELKTVESWRSEVGYNETDPTFSEGMRIGPDGKPAKIRVLFGHGAEYDTADYQLSRNEKPFGVMHITWKNEESLPSNAGQPESAWLFEKATGFPKRLFPERQDAVSLPKFDDIATETVTGDEEAARLFGGGRQLE